MTTLGLAGNGTPKAELGMGFRAGWLKHVGLAISGASGAAVVMGAYEVLRSQPDKAFALLQGWGPVFLVAIVGLFVVGRLFEGLNATVRESFTVVAGGLEHSASSAGRTADALTRLADQGNRQFEQVERLAIYAASEFPGVYERLDQQDKVLKEIALSVNTLVVMRNRGGGQGGGDGSGS
jgi:hypothetical protein